VLSLTMLSNPLPVFLLALPHRLPHPQVYLTTMPAADGGGHTVFPALDIAVLPRKGDAILWNNNDEGGGCTVLLCRLSSCLLGKHTYAYTHTSTYPHTHTHLAHIRTHTRAHTHARVVQQMGSSTRRYTRRMLLCRVMTGSRANTP